MNHNLKVPSLQSLIESDRGSNDSLLADSIQLDIEELDDEEYAIPALHALPTLENVLSDMASDVDSELASELGFAALLRPGNNGVGIAGNSSVSGATGNSNSLGGDISSVLGGEPTARMGTILRHVALRGVSAQISSATDRINAGLATCMDMTRVMTAVGTSHGHVLAFDAQQALRWGWSPEASQHGKGAAAGDLLLQPGAVAALAFNADASRLLAGFARGLLIMIDTSSGDTLRTMADLVTPNTGVLNVRWTQHAATALCSDSGGSVWMLSFTRRLGIRGASSRCIFSGARGEVCTIAPLCFAEGHAAAGAKASAQSDGGGSVGNGSSAAAAEVALRPFCVAAMATLTKFVVVTVRPRLRVIKYRPLAGPADCLPLLAWHMVLIQTTAGTAQRSVDPVLCAAHGRSVFFYQLCVRDGRLLLLFLRHITVGYDLLAVHWLGPKMVAALDKAERLHLHDIRSDRELEEIDMASADLVYASAQFKGLATGGNVSPALALAGTHACYNSVLAHDNRVFLLGGRSVHSVSVRAWSERIAHLVTHRRWVEACALATDGWRSAVDGSAQAGGDRSGGRPERVEQAENTVRWLADEYLEKSSNPTDDTWPGLEAMIDCLIVTGQHDILYGALWDRHTDRPQRYLRALTEHICGATVREIAPAVAQSLCAHWQRYDPERLEQLVLLLDWRCLDLHQVLTAVRREKLWQAQIYLNATALGDYCASLVDLVPLILDEDRRLGNYLLVYVSSCLAGRGFPRGEIAADRQAMVKHEVLRCLTAVHSNGAAADELPYPYLRQLLHFDTRDTLNVLALAFAEKEFSGELGASHRQRFVHILLEIMSPETDCWPEIGSLLNFIAQQLAARNLPAHSDRELLERVMGHLRREHIPDESPGQLAEREHAWLELLNNDCLAHLTMGDQLRSARAARCFRVVQALLERRRCFEDILPCYLDAPEGRRHTEMWGYMRRWAHSEERQIFVQLCTHLEQLLRIDAAAVARLAVDCYSGRMDELFERLAANEAALFRLMHALDEQQRFVFETAAAERYVELLCKHDVERVLGFLQQSANGNSNGSGAAYRVDVLLELVRDNPALSAALVYLHERCGDYAAAFDECMRLLEAERADEELAQQRARELSALCQRAAAVVAPPEAQRMWFAVIGAVLPRGELRSCTREVLHAASRYVDLADMVQRIMEVTPLGDGNAGAEAEGPEFGDIRHILAGMLANAQYERRLLRGTARVLGADLHEQSVRSRRRAARGLRVQGTACVVCNERLTNGANASGDVLVLGGCGHAVHWECWPEEALDGGQRRSDAAEALMAGGVGGETVRCPRCGARVHQEAGVFRPFAVAPTTGAVPRGRSPIGSALQLEAPPRIGIGGS